MGLTADMGGPALALVEIAHWYETVYLFAIVLLFFSSSWIAAVLGLSFTFLLIVILDNAMARLKWEATLSFAWIAALIAGASNLIPFYLISRGTP